MGVTIRTRRDKDEDVWWVFVNYRNRRTSFKAGSHREALEIQRELQVMLALDRVFGAAESKKSVRDGEALRLRLTRLLGRLDKLLEENRRRG